MPLLGIESSSHAFDSIPSLFFSPNREFSITTSRPAQRLRTDDPRFTAYQYQSSIAPCGLSPEQSSQRLASALGTGGIVAAILDPVAPEWRDRLVQNRVLVVVDDFGDNREVFSSFYARAAGPETLRILALDCARENRREWAALLVHEMVHALLDGAHYPAWIEEGLAQVLEAQAGGSHPERSLSANTEELRLDRFTLERRAPLRSSAAYARSYLAARQLFEARGRFDWVRRLILHREEPGDLSPFARSEI